MANMGRYYRRRSGSGAGGPLDRGPVARKGRRGLHQPEHPPGVPWGRKHATATVVDALAGARPGRWSSARCAARVASSSGRGGEPGVEAAEHPRPSPATGGPPPIAAAGRSGRSARRSSPPSGGRTPGLPRGAASAADVGRRGCRARTAGRFDVADGRGEAAVDKSATVAAGCFRAPPRREPRPAGNGRPWVLAGYLRTAGHRGVAGVRPRCPVRRSRSAPRWSPSIAGRSAGMRRPSMRFTCGRLLERKHRAVAEATALLDWRLAPVWQRARAELGSGMLRLMETHPGRGR